MKFKLAPFCFIAFWVSACTWGVQPKKNPAITKDTMSYAYKTIKKTASNCAKLPDSECTTVNIRYPVFKDQHALNDSVKNQLLKLFLLRDTAAKSLEQIALSFINSYENDKKQDVHIEKYTLNMSAVVLRQDSALTTLEIDCYTYQGGAHGAERTYFINWNSKEGKKIGLNDIFADGYKEPLNKIAEHIFRTDEKLSDTATLANDYFFKDNKFQLNENFMITPLGVRFLYNEYEIKPYSAGQTNLVIPYKPIKSLLRPHTVVSQYIK